MTPDPVTGQVFRPLQGRDLVVVDEASMVTTAHLAAITTVAARAGAKVVLVGDPHQLDAVDAGGLFTHLAATLSPGQVHALAQPHRFREAWEAEASLQVRAGDPRAVEAYADRGRLLAGTVEDMSAAARRGWLADRLDGLDAVLVVGSNATAADMSAELQAELRALGRLHHEPLADLGDGNRAYPGDVVEARRNAWHLRVDPSSDGTAEAVMNRGRYTLVGCDPDGAVLGRDRRGGVAHLPVAYLAEHAALGYASTVHGAEGVTVDAAHGLVDRDATREATYVQVTRGARHNYLYLVTERDPDAHEPQRLDEAASERLARVLEVTGAQHSASALRVADEAELASAPTLLARLDHATRAGAAFHLAAVGHRLGVDLDPGDPATERLLGALRAVEFDGHDPAVLLDRAIAARGFEDVDSTAAVLAHRLRGQALAAAPQPDRLAAQPDDRPGRGVDPVDWPGRVRVHGNHKLDVYARQVAGLIDARQAELGDRVAAAPAGWARTLGDRPDPELDFDAEQLWRRTAGVTAFYREAAGIDPDQVSLGAPPPRDRPVERALYDAALAAAKEPAAQPAGRYWRAEPDAELYAARERWARELDQAPPWVADQLAHTHTLARGYREDAALDGARAAALPDSPARAQIADDTTHATRFAEQHEARAADLEDAHHRRGQWWAGTTPCRKADTAAVAELERRGLPAARVVPDEPVVERRPMSPRRDAGTDQVSTATQPRDETDRSFEQLRAIQVSVEARRAERDAARQSELPRLEQAARDTARDHPHALRGLDDNMLVDDEIANRRPGLTLPRLQRKHTRQLQPDDGPELGR